MQNFGPADRIRKAVSHPDRIIPYLRRAVRNRRLRRRARSHTDFYRAVVDETARKDPERAIGSTDREHWLGVGELQFDYLVKHGLEPHHRVLDIGCGNLRAGWRLIDYLNEGNYYGIDISYEILLAALDVVEEFGLQRKMPRLALVPNLRFSFLPEDCFDVVHAHSVFTHTPLDVLDECLAHVGRIMKPSGFFDLTWFQTDGEPHSRLGEDFYYPFEQISAAAESHGFACEVMEDWNYPQSKARLRGGGH